MKKLFTLIFLLTLCGVGWADSLSFQTDGTPNDSMMMSYGYTVITDRSFGGQTVVDVGRLSSASYRAWLRWPNIRDSLITEGATAANVDSAVLYLYMTFHWGTSTESLFVYPMDSAWWESTETGAVGDSIGASWKYKHNVITQVDSLWDAGGSYATGDVQDTAIVTLAGDAANSDTVEFTLKQALVSSWMTDAANNLGVLIRMGDETQAKGMIQAGSDDHGTAALRPKLTVYWTSGIPTVVGAATVGAATVGSQ